MGFLVHFHQIFQPSERLKLSDYFTYWDKPNAPLASHLEQELESRKTLDIWVRILTIRASYKNPQLSFPLEKCLCLFTKFSQVSPWIIIFSGKIFFLCSFLSISLHCQTEFMHWLKAQNNTHILILNSQHKIWIF